MVISLDAFCVHKKGADILFVVAFTLNCTNDTYLVTWCATQVFTFSLFKFIKSCLCYGGAEGFRLVWG